MHCMAAFCRRVGVFEGRSLYVICYMRKEYWRVFLWLRENYLARLGIVKRKSFWQRFEDDPWGTRTWNWDLNPFFFWQKTTIFFHEIGTRSRTSTTPPLHAFTTWVKPQEHHNKSLWLIKSPHFLNAFHSPISNPSLETQELYPPASSPYLPFYNINA